MRLTQPDPDQAISERVAAEVRAEIARQGKTRAAVATQLGWTESRLSNRMTGKVPLTVSELTHLAAVLGVSATQFLPAPAVTR